jgi:hypothetical protein
MDKTLFLELKPGQALKVCKVKPYYLAARSPLWVTWPGSGDLILSAGDSVLIPAGAGCVVAQGLVDKSLSDRERDVKAACHRVSA